MSGGEACWTRADAAAGTTAQYLAKAASERPRCSTRPACQARPAGRHPGRSPRETRGRFSNPTASGSPIRLRDTRGIRLPVAVEGQCSRRDKIDFISAACGARRIGIRLKSAMFAGSARSGSEGRPRGRRRCEGQRKVISTNTRSQLKLAKTQRSKRPPRHNLTRRALARRRVSPLRQPDHQLPLCPPNVPAFSCGRQSEAEG